MRASLQDHPLHPPPFFSRSTAFWQGPCSAFPEVPQVCHTFGKMSTLNVNLVRNQRIYFLRMSGMKTRLLLSLSADSQECQLTLAFTCFCPGCGKSLYSEGQFSKGIFLICPNQFHNRRLVSCYRQWISQLFSLLQQETRDHVCQN